MGKAIIIPDVNFASANLGQVTLTGDIPVRAISIVAPESFIGVTLNTLRVIYNPLNTTEREVTWSIINGSSYATIDETTGILTVLNGAILNNVTIKATSTVDSSIIAEATIIVTYQVENIILYDWMKVTNGYVDLGLKASALMSIEIKLGGNVKSGNIGFFGASNDSADTESSINAELFWRPAISGQDKNFQCVGLGKSAAIRWNADDIGPYTTKTDLVSPYVKTLPDISWTGNFEGFGDGHLNNLTLFGINLNGTIWGGNETQIWNTKIYDDNVLTHEYVACTINGTPYIYDKLTNNTLLIQGINGQPIITYGNEI